MEKPTPDPWLWSTCSLPLRYQMGQNVVLWSLKPTIALTHPKLDDVEPLVNLNVETEKSFQYSEDLGWNWHKSWNIPTINLRFDITDPNNNEKLLCPGDFKAHMIAVKPYLTTENSILLADVGIQGTSQVDIIDGKAVFQGLKFASTSFNNEGVKFHLVICVYLQITEDAKPKVLKTLISPPIFVDSRRGIRDNEKSALKENPLFGFAQPFFPDKFTKKFVRKDPKRKDAPHEDIQNSIEGLYSYLTAPNIRNKIKHPMFLSVRFSSCISLYYNPNKITDREMDNLAEYIQGMLHEDLIGRTASHEVDINDSYFIMWLDTDTMEDKIKKKKFWELVFPLRYRSLAVVALKSEIPSYFVQINDTKWMAELYSKAYPNIIMSSKEIFNEEDLDEDEAGPDKIAPPEIQVIPCNPDNSTTASDTLWKRYIEFPEKYGLPTKKVKDEQNSLPITGKIEDDKSSIDSRDPDQKQKQMLGNPRGTAQTEQNPIIRTAPNVNMGHPMFFNQLPQNRMPPFTHGVVDPNQLSSLWMQNPTMGNINPALQQQLAYRNLGMNVGSLPMMGYNIPGQIGQMGGLNMQPMLNRDLNKAMMGEYAAALQNPELYEVKRESGTPSQGFEIKSEANIKEEDEL